MTNFSVLMSVYIKEKPEHLDQCLKSLKEQTIPPSEIVIVQDGPITKELLHIIEKWKRYSNIVDVVLPTNKGLGKALNIGLQNCNNELIARMDTDDICLPTRFEKQLKIFKHKEVDVVGSWISEFDQNPNKVISIRKVPTSYNSIKQTAQYKNPLNHPSVIYKKSIIEKYGNYEDVLYFEDYYLWLKLIHNNVKIHNIPEPLVHMRAGLEQLSRRSGYSYAKKELYFLRKSLANNYIQRKSFLIQLFTKIPSRLLPRTLLKLIYQLSRSK